MNTPPRELDDQQLLNDLIDHFASGQADGPLAVPSHSLLGQWLQYFAQAAGQPWRQQSLRWVIDPDGLGLAISNPTALTARQVLRFYGYPYPANPAQCGVVLNALRVRRGFADPGVQDAYARLHRDVQSIAEALRALVVRLDLVEEPFNLFALYRTRFALNSGSVWDEMMKTGAAQLQALAEHPAFLAVEQARSLTTDNYVFDPSTGLISGSRNSGTRVEIEHAHLLALPLQGLFDQLSLTGAQMNTFIYQDGRFSLAQLLRLHQLPHPSTRAEAWDLLEQLQTVQAVAVPAACDFAHSEIALQAYAQAPAALPAKPRWGNYWEVLQPGALMLSAAQRDTIISIVAGWLPSTGAHLLDIVLGDLALGEPDDTLQRLLNGAAAQQLAQQLLSAVGWFGQYADEPTTRASRDALVLGALILNLDPQAGETRYTVSGLNLHDENGWGSTYAQLRQRVEQHLIERGVATARTAALAAHLMLAGVAPECLVRDIPASLYFMRSYAWMLFKQGVLQAEALACGVSRQLSFIEVITLGASEGPATELTWREHYATASLIDWSVANNLLDPDQQSYPLNSLQSLKHLLATRIQALRQASETLSTPMTTRHAIALADLQRVFPDHPLLDSPCLRWAGGPTHPLPYRPPADGAQLSLVQLHMSGHLHLLSPYWRTCDVRLSLARLKLGLPRLGDVNALFNLAAEGHVARLKQAYTFAMQYLLTQLPRADRQAIQRGDVQVLVVHQAAKVPLDQEQPLDKQARTGRFGVLLRCEYLGQTRVYELFPLINQVQHNPRLRADLKVGGEPLHIITGGPTSARPMSLLYTGTPLALDWQAYATGQPPRADQTANVVIDRLALVLPTDAASDLSLDSARNRALAQGIAEQHFFLDIDALLSAARGSTLLEKDQQASDALLRGILNLVPFLSCTTELASGDTRRMIDGSWGCFFDLVGLLAPTRLLALRGLSRLKSALPPSRKLLQLAGLSAGYLNAILNPLDSAPSLLRLGRLGLVHLNRAGLRLLDEAVGLARKRLALGGGINFAPLLQRADVGAARLVQADGITRLLVLRRPGAWYAFDPFSGKAYGPPLEQVQLDDALPVIPMHSADGYKAWTPEPLSDTPLRLIQRGDAIDLLHNQRLWRLDPQRPDQLHELASPAYVHLGDRFEFACAADRTKRSPVPILCLSKKLYPFRKSIHKRRMQALDHLRLIPGPSVDAASRKLVLHRRIHEVTSQAEAFQLRALRPTEPLVYREHVSARRIDHEPQFGLPGDELDTLLERQTQVLKIESIVEGIDDSRTLRALDVTLPGVFTRPQWVVEADTGVFYRTPATPTGPNALQLQQLDYARGGEDQALIDAFCNWRHEHLAADGLIPDQPLVMLPPLETLYRQMARRGIEPERLARIRGQVASLSVMKQRELLLNLSDQGRRLDINVVSQPVQLDIWPPRPPTSSDIPVNRWMAEQASTRTLAQVEKTGIGPANVATTNIEDVRRWQVAHSVVMWQYSQYGTPDFTEIVLKTGAGNCDQMAHVAHEMIRTNGGTAQIWITDPRAHAFVVVGKQPTHWAPTVDFSEPVWADLWVCDPWTSIACRASDYVAQLRLKMAEWDALNTWVFFNDGGLQRWARATDPLWLQSLTDSTKYPRP